VVRDIQGVPGGKVSILGDHSFGHSKQKNFVCTHDLFQTVSEIELFHCTVVWIWRPILSFPAAILRHCLKHVNCVKHQLAVSLVFRVKHFEEDEVNF